MPNGFDTSEEWPRLHVEQGTTNEKVVFALREGYKIKGYGEWDNTNGENKRENMKRETKEKN